MTLARRRISCRASNTGSSTPHQNAKIRPETDSHQIKQYALYSAPHKFNRGREPCQVPKAIDGVPVRWLNSHYLNVEPLIARTYGAIPQSLPFSHYRFAERARRSGRSDRIAKHLHKVRDTTGGVPRLSDAAVSHLECGAACPSS